ncbi:MAG TPA: hypothetical protein VFM45_03040, partial [Anaeromyxobacteraceae bacterium]|nr:hypothetical protein [Anaeromyxobacteraceae bacterium]
MKPASLALLLAACAGCATAGASAGAPPAPTPVEAARPLSLELDGRWIGNGISYGPHRDGQWPGGPAPTEAQLR